MYHKFVGITTVEFGEGPRKQSLHVLDSVHMAFPSCEFVFTMENPVVVVAVENQSRHKPSSRQNESSSLQAQGKSIIGIKLSFEQSGTIRTMTFPPRFRRPKTGVLPAAPRPVFHGPDERQNKIHQPQIPRSLSLFPQGLEALFYGGNRCTSCSPCCDLRQQFQCRRSQRWSEHRCRRS